jgi:hypothetical protein
MEVGNTHEIDLEVVLQTLSRWSLMADDEKRAALRRMDWTQRTRRDRLPRSKTTNDVNVGSTCALLGLFLLLISIVYSQNVNTKVWTFFTITTPLMIPLAIGIHRLLRRQRK